MATKHNVNARLYKAGSDLLMAGSLISEYEEMIGKMKDDLNFTTDLYTHEPVYKELQEKARDLQDWINELLSSHFLAVSLRTADLSIFEEETK